MCMDEKTTHEIMAIYGNYEEELKGNNSKDAIVCAVHVEFYGKMTRAREEKSKLKFFLEGKQPGPLKYRLSIC